MDLGTYVALVMKMSEAAWRTAGTGWITVAVARYSLGHGSRSCLFQLTDGRPPCKSKSREKRNSPDARL